MTALNPVYRVGDQIVEATQPHEPMSDDEARKRVEELYRLAGTPPDQVDHYPPPYRARVKARPIIAMALALRPPPPVLDEPTTALEPITAAKTIGTTLLPSQAL